MKNRRCLFILILFTGLMTACHSELDIEISTENPDIVETPIGIQSTIDVEINGEETISFTFDECAFDDLMKQRTTNSIGTMNDKNTKGLATRIYNRNEDETVETELVLITKFVNYINDGLIDATTIDEIMSTHNSAERSEFFGLEIGIKKNGDFFSNLQNEFDPETNTKFFNYTPDFHFKIKDYEVGYDSECMEDLNFLRIEADFEGKLYHSEMNEITDSLNVEVLNVEMLLVID